MPASMKLMFMTATTVLSEGRLLDRKQFVLFRMFNKSACNDLLNDPRNETEVRYWPIREEVEANYDLVDNILNSCLFCDPESTLLIDVVG